MSTEASRVHDWVDDKNNVIPITASRMDAEFDAIITKLNQKVIIKASAPSAPIAGMLWYDSTNKFLKQYRNAEWVIMGVVHVGTSAPSTVQEGDLWYDTTNNVLKAYDGSNYAQASVPVGTEGGMTYYDGSGSLGTVDQGVSGLPLVAKGSGAPIFEKVGSAGVGTLGSQNIGTNAIITTHLKTGQGEITSTGDEYLTLPGGEYGFYPRTKISATGSTH